MMEKEQTALQLIAEAARCPVYEPERILALMEKLGINEKRFALLMNVVPFTVWLWTSGASQPSGTAMRLMQIFETAPEIVVRLLENQKVRCLEETGVREIFQRDKTNEIIGENIMNYIFCSGDTV